VKDKYGLAWQIVPTVLFELMVDKDPAKTERVMQAMLGMKKLDIRELKRAAEGPG
jgi:predicted 3-demethylubiquinone-9 3-methyltransferase (glyoxalase superfamily)